MTTSTYSNDFDSVCARTDGATWYEKLANYLVEKNKFKVIYDRETQAPYMIRYYPLWADRPWWFPFNITLHHILRSDIDSFHDHPWPFWGSLILKGGYYEHTPSGTSFRKPGTWGFHLQKFLHWLELPKGKSCWSIFFMGPSTKEWGFINEKNVWEQWESYLERKRNSKKKINNTMASQSVNINSSAISSNGTGATIPMAGTIYAVTTSGAGTGGSGISGTWTGGKSFTHIGAATYPSGATTHIGAATYPSGGGGGAWSTNSLYGAVTGSSSYYFNNMDMLVLIPTYDGQNSMTVQKCIDLTSEYINIKNDIKSYPALASIWDEFVTARKLILSGSNIEKENG